MSATDVIAVAAAVIALMSMLATLWQSWTVRRHNRLSVRPHLDFFRNYGIGGPVSLSLINHGLGPAIIKRVVVHYLGRDYEVVDDSFPAGLSDELNRCGTRAELILMGPDTPFPSAGREVLLVFPDTVDNLFNRNAAVKALQHFGFTFEYQSIYEEQYVLNVRPPARDGVEGTGAASTSL